MKTAHREHVIDFGLNLEAGVERIGFPLSAGLVRVTNPETGEGEPQWFSRLKATDSISYRVWNQTVSASTRARLVSFRATWVNPSRFNELSSPLAQTKANPTVFSGPEIRSVESSEALSSVYPQNRGGWIFGAQESAPSPLGASFEFGPAVTSVGIYFLRARLDVVIDERTMRTFHWDPEIIVGAGGGEPPPPGYAPPNPDSSES